MIKDKREPMLVIKGKEINVVLDALEILEELEVDDKNIGKDATNLLNKIRQVMRLD